MIFSILPAITLYSWEVSFVLNGKFSQKIHKHKSFRAKYAWSFYISPHVLARCAICLRYKYFSTLFMYFIIIYCRICGRIEFWTQPLSTSLPWVVLVFPLYENFRRACLSIWPNPSVRVTFLNNSLLRRRLSQETKSPSGNQPEISSLNISRNLRFSGLKNPAPAVLLPAKEPNLKVLKSEEPNPEFSSLKFSTNQISKPCLG